MQVLEVTRGLPKDPAPSFDEAVILNCGFPPSGKTRPVLSHRVSKGGMLENGSVAPCARGDVRCRSETHPPVKHPK